MKRRSFIEKSVFALTYASLGATILQGCADEVFFFEKNQRIGCIGDSVTYAGGDGYVELLQKFVDQNYPGDHLEFINLGLNSETITGLTEPGHPGPRPFLFDRLDKILDQSSIDIAFFCYGINCGIYGEPSEELFNKYRAGVDRFLDRMQKEKIKIILLTPPPLALETAKKNGNTKLEVLDKNYSWLTPFEHYDKEVLQEFKRIILEIDHPAVIQKIDIHTPLTKYNDRAYNWDPIHPNAFGNKIITDTLVEVLFK